jgi:hypothetical protein
VAPPIATVTNRRLYRTQIGQRERPGREPLPARTIHDLSRDQQDLRPPSRVRSGIGHVFPGRSALHTPADCSARPQGRQWQPPGTD